MTDLERRLHESLAVRAGQVDPALDGAELRRAAQRRAHTRRRTGVQALAAAAVVAALAIGQQALTHVGHDHAPKAPAGGRTMTTSVPSTRPSPRTASPSRNPSRPVQSSAPVRSTPAPSPTARPSRAPTTSYRYVPPPPPRASTGTSTGISAPRATTGAPGA